MEVSIPRKLYDEREPTINIKIKDYECHALCDLGASVSMILKTLCDVIGLCEFDYCSLNLHLADSTIKKPMGRIDDVLIAANRNYVPVDFIVLDIDCNPTCPIILGRPFLRTIGAIIDMKEGNIRFQFPLRKGMKHFPRRNLNCLMNPLWEPLMDCMPKMIIHGSIHVLCLALRALNNSACWEATQFYFCSLPFAPV